LSLGVVPKPRRIAGTLLVATLAIAPSAAARAHDGAGSRAAAAATDEEPELAHARALFDEAGQLEREGQWARAQDRLRQALRIRETPHLRYALGWALENDDKLVAARSEYEAALELAARSGAAKVGRLATDRLTALERATPVIEVRAPEQATRVVVDARATEVKDGVASVPVDPGVHIVRVERRERPDAVERVYVTRGVLRIVEVRGDALAPAKESRVLPWSLVAGGGALALTGVVILAASAADATARDEATQRWCDATACSGGAATRPETPEAVAFRRDAADATARGNTKQAIGAAVGAVGLAAAGVGVFLLLRAHDERGPRLDASLGPGSASASAAFRF
jgi:hypothetical protein